MHDWALETNGSCKSCSKDRAGMGQQMKVTELIEVSSRLCEWMLRGY